MLQLTKDVATEAKAAEGKIIEVMEELVRSHLMLCKDAFQ